MSSRSRARFRHDHDDHDDAVAAPDPDTVAAVDDMLATFDKGDQRGGISKWAGLILRDREKALAEPDRDEPAPVKDRPDYGLRAPTPYEAAVLSALGNRTTVIDGVRGPVCVPVAIASGGMYGGTVEPERVAKRRRRNKMARATRRGQRLKVRGRVYESRFGYPIRVPGISAGVDIDGAVDAEVVDA